MITSLQKVQKPQLQRGAEEHRSKIKSTSSVVGVLASCANEGKTSGRQSDRKHVSPSWHPPKASRIEITVSLTRFTTHSSGNSATNGTIAQGSGLTGVFVDTTHYFENATLKDSAGANTCRRRGPRSARCALSLPRIAVPNSKNCSTPPFRPMRL